MDVINHNPKARPPKTVREATTCTVLPIVVFLPCSVTPSKANSNRQCLGYCLPCFNVCTRPCLPRPTTGGGGRIIRGRNTNRTTFSVTKTCGLIYSNGIIFEVIIEI